MRRGLPQGLPRACASSVVPRGFRFRLNEDPRFPPPLPPALSRSSLPQAQNPDPRCLNSPRAAPGGIRHFPAFNSKADSSSLLAPGPQEGWPRATGENRCRRRRQSPRARLAVLPHTWFRSPVQEAGAPAHLGTRFVAPRPVARLRHAPGPPLRDPEAGARRGAAGAAGRSGPRIVGRSGGRVDRGPIPGPAARGG